MNDYSLILWAILFAIFAIICFWHVRENRLLTQKWRKELDDFSARWLTQFAWSRSVQLLVLLFCGVIVIAAYDWKLQSTRQSLHSLQTTSSDNLKDRIALQESVTSAKRCEAKLKAALAKAATPPPACPTVNATQYYPPAPKSDIEELYGTETETNSQNKQDALDSLKKRYEEILINNMFLRKCGKAGENDIHIIISALSQEMASINAPGRLQYDILNSARGSYKEMYAKSPCEAKGIDALHAQYKKYVDTIAKQLTDR